MSTTVVNIDDHKALLHMAIIETGSLKEGYELFRQVTAEFDSMIPIPAPTPVPAPAQIISEAPRRKKPMNHHRPWSEGEIAKANSMAQAHAHFEDIARALGRSFRAVYNAWYNHKFEHPAYARRVRPPIVEQINEQAA